MTSGCRRIHRPSLIVAFLLLSGAAASAEPLIVTPSVGLAETFTDNVFFDDTDKADAITRLRLHLNFAYQTATSTTNFSAGTSAAYLARNSTTTVDLAEAQRLALSTTYDYSPRLRFSIGDHLGRVGSGVRDLSFIDNPHPQGGTPTPPPDEDPGGNNPSNVNFLLPSGAAFNNSLGVTASYLATPLWTVGVNLTNGVSNFADPSSTDVTQGIALSLGHRYSDTISLNGRFGYNYFYSNESLDSDTYSLSVGPSYEPASLWRIATLVGGSLNRTIKTGSLRATANVYIDVIRILENSVVSAGVRNGFTPSAGVATGTSQTFDTHLAYSRKLTSWLSGSTSFTYSHFNTTSNDFDLFTLRTGLFYPIWKNLTGSLNYAYHRSDGGAVRAEGGGATTGVVDSNVLSLQITWATPLWQFDL